MKQNSVPNPTTNSEGKPESAGMCRFSSLTTVSWICPCTTSSNDVRGVNMSKGKTGFPDGLQSDSIFFDLHFLTLTCQLCEDPHTHTPAYPKLSKTLKESELLIHPFCFHTYQIVLSGAQNKACTTFSSMRVRKRNASRIISVADKIHKLDHKAVYRRKQSQCCWSSNDLRVNALKGL